MNIGRKYRLDRTIRKGYGPKRESGDCPGTDIFYRQHQLSDLNIIKKEGGQVLSEFTAMLVMFIGVALTLMLLLAIFTEYGWRLVSLVALEYP